MNAGGIDKGYSIYHGCTAVGCATWDAINRLCQQIYNVERGTKIVNR